MAWKTISKPSWTWKMMSGTQRLSTIGASLVPAFDIYMYVCMYVCTTIYFSNGLWTLGCPWVTRCHLHNLQVLSLFTWFWVIDLAITYKPDANFPFNKLCSNLVEHHLSHMSKSPYQICQVPSRMPDSSWFCWGKSRSHLGLCCFRAWERKNKPNSYAQQQDKPLWTSPSPTHKVSEFLLCPRTQHNPISLHMPFPQTPISRV